MKNTNIIHQASKMFLLGSSRKEVITFLENQGIAKNQTDEIATKAYIAVKAKRKALISAIEAQRKPSVRVNNGAGVLRALLGAGIAGAGIMATMNSNSIWYGAIFVGILMFFQGLMEMSE